MLELISFDIFYHFGKFRNREVIYVRINKSTCYTFLFVNIEYSVENGQNDLYEVNVLNFIMIFYKF